MLITLILVLSMLNKLGKREREKMMRLVILTIIVFWGVETIVYMPRDFLDKANTLLPGACLSRFTPL